MSAVVRFFRPLQFNKVLENLRQRKLTSGFSKTVSQQPIVLRIKSCSLLHVTLMDWETGVVIKCCWIVCEINQTIHYSYIICHCIHVSRVSKSRGPTEYVILKDNLHAHITSFSSSYCNYSWHNVAFQEFCNHYLPSAYHMLMNQELNEITSLRCCSWYHLPPDFFPNDGKLYMVLSAILCPWINKGSLDHFWNKYAQYKELYTLLNLIKVQIPTA